MIVKEIRAKSILSRSKVFDYTVNPYIGCEHACAYCYARFIKRFTGHREEWGQFVDVKVNAADLLQREIKRKRAARVWISGLCDPYQPIERKYELTGRCLRILSENEWPVTIQTKSALVLRDMELLKKSRNLDVGFTITTAEEAIRRIFEPNAASIMQRVETLERLHSEGIKTFAMIAPLLPGFEGLVTQLAGKIDYVLVDRMNYRYADWLYRKHNLDFALTDEFFARAKVEVAEAFVQVGVPCQVLF